MCIPRERGFTLPELILLILVLAVGLAVIVLPLTQSVTGSVDPLVRKQTVAIAESMMEEVQLMAFANPSGGFSGGGQANRYRFDDVNDYNGFNSNPPGGIVTIDGTAVAGLSGYNVSVAVQPNTSFGVPGLQVPAASGVRITVTATGPGGFSYTLDGYKANTP